MEYNKDFAIIPHNPKTITWDILDNTELGVLKEYKYRMVIGLPPRNLINYDEGCFVLFRPEWQLFKNGLNTDSNVLECTIEIHFLAKKEPTKELLLGISDIPHNMFLECFDERYSKEGNIYKLRPTDFDKNGIEIAIKQAMIDAKWAI